MSSPLYHEPQAFAVMAEADEQYDVAGAQLTLDDNEWLSGLVEQTGQLAAILNRATTGEPYTTDEVYNSLAITGGIVLRWMRATEIR